MIIARPAAEGATDMTIRQMLAARAHFALRIVSPSQARCTDRPPKLSQFPM
jgi:hypothetical protein